MRCTFYSQRQQRVEDCVDVRQLFESGGAEALACMPASCAYRLRAENKALPAWHHLVCGDRERVHSSGSSVQGRTIAEEFVHPDDLEEFIVSWVEV